jgi:hypothetical protein
MKPRFQADADFNQDIVNAVLRREPGIKFETALDANLFHLPDAEVLALAALDGRILVTHDRRTMPHHFAAFILTKQCPGVFIVSQELPVAVVVEELILIWATTEAEEWINCICNIPL